DAAEVLVLPELVVRRRAVDPLREPAEVPALRVLEDDALDLGRLEAVDRLAQRRPRAERARRVAEPAVEARRDLVLLERPVELVAREPRGLEGRDDRAREVLLEEPGGEPRGDAEVAVARR